MQKMSGTIKKWTSIDTQTGNRVLNDDAPNDVKNEAIAFEKEFFIKTARQRIVNIDIG